MKQIKTFFDQFKHAYTMDERILSLVFVSLFLPWWISMVVLCGAAMYVLVKTDFMKLIKDASGGKVLMFIPIYCVVVSIFNENWYGAAISLGMAFAFLLVLHYRKYIHKDLFSLLVDVAIAVSLIAVVYGVFEQFYYMSQIEGMGFFDIQNKPQYRVHTFFFNANYYALMILFIECMCIYKFFLAKTLKEHVYYTLVGVANLFALFLTGGRVAWVGLAIGVVVMVVLNRWWKTLIGVLGAAGGAVGVLSLKPGLIPRLAQRGFKLERRRQIWQAAWLMIKEHGIFGGGPLAYYSWYEGYQDLYIATYGLKSFKKYKLGISAPHAHTMFLEVFISFGVVGTLLLLTYLGMQIKRVISLITKKIDYTLASLIFGCFAVTLSFCILDFPILWHQTAVFVFLMLGSADIYKEELETC